MKTRILTKGFLASIIQIGVYYMTINLLWFIGKIFYTPPTNYIDSFALILSLELFGIIVSIQNLITATFNKKWLTLTMLFLAFLIYVFGWGEDIVSFPFTTIVFILAGLFALTIKFFIDNEIDKKFALLNRETR